jgi:hypothetical protein
MIVGSTYPLFNSNQLWSPRGRVRPSASSSRAIWPRGPITPPSRCSIAASWWTTARRSGHRPAGPSSSRRVARGGRRRGAVAAQGGGRIPPSPAGREEPRGGRAQPLYLRQHPPSAAHRSGTALPPGGTAALPARGLARDLGPPGTCMGVGPTVRRVAADRRQRLGVVVFLGAGRGPVHTGLAVVVGQPRRTSPRRGSGRRERRESYSHSAAPTSRVGYPCLPRCCS